MHRLYPVTLHRPGFMKREGPARRRQRFHHQPVFVEGEAAAGRGWRDIAGMVNDLEHAWLAVDRQAIEAARRSGRAKRQRRRPAAPAADLHPRSEEHTSELQSLLRISYAVFCLQ